MYVHVQVCLYPVSTAGHQNKELLAVGCWLNVAPKLYSVIFPNGVHNDDYTAAGLRYSINVSYYRCQVVRFQPTFSLEGFWDDRIRVELF